jgi:hypothetical protein
MNCTTCSVQLVQAVIGNVTVVEYVLAEPVVGTPAIPSHGSPAMQCGNRLSANTMPLVEMDPPVAVTATADAVSFMASVYSVTTGSGSTVAVAAEGATGANAMRKWPLWAIASTHVTVIV